MRAHVICRHQRDASPVGNQPPSCHGSWKQQRPPPSGDGLQSGTVFGHAGDPAILAHEWREVQGPHRRTARTTSTGALCDREAPSRASFRETTKATVFDDGLYSLPRILPGTPGLPPMMRHLWTRTQALRSEATRADRLPLLAAHTEKGC